MTRYYICQCDSTGREIVVYLIYGIEGLLQIIALIFAISIRKVNVKGLDDSRFVIVSVYVGTVTLIIAVVAVTGLINYVNYLTVITFTVHYIGVTTILLLMFMPKVSILLPYCFLGI